MKSFTFSKHAQLRARQRTAIEYFESIGLHVEFVGDENGTLRVKGEYATLAFCPNTEHFVEEKLKTEGQSLHRGQGIWQASQFVTKGPSLSDGPGFPENTADRSATVQKIQNVCRSVKEDHGDILSPWQRQQKIAKRLKNEFGIKLHPEQIKAFMYLEPEQQKIAIERALELREQELHRKQEEAYQREQMQHRQDHSLSLEQERRKHAYQGPKPGRR